MSPPNVPRRQFLRTAGLVTAAVAAGAPSFATAAQQGGRMHLATNQYPWLTFYGREGRDFKKSLDAGLAEIKAAGLDGYEPLVTSPGEIDELLPLLKKHGLEMRSLYVNSVLHDAAQAEKSIAEVLEIAAKAKAAGTRWIVTNPSPIRWGGPENKDDAQLKTQAVALERLGNALAAEGLRLAYHHHDIELRCAARELHHMLLATDPKLVTLCLDTHWVYRGAGNSAVALMDVLKLYGQRVSEMHLRQSQGGVWTEALGEGDIDYATVVEYLTGLSIKPHLVLEQAVEAGTPKTMDAVAAHRRSSEYARRVFARLRG